MRYFLFPPVLETRGSLLALAAEYQSGWLESQKEAISPQHHLLGVHLHHHFLESASPQQLMALMAEEEVQIELQVLATPRDMVGFTYR